MNGSEFKVGDIIAHYNNFDLDELLIVYKSEIDYIWAYSLLFIPGGLLFSEKQIKINIKSLFYKNCHKV